MRGLFLLGRCVLILSERLVMEFAQANILSIRPTLDLGQKNPATKPDLKEYTV